MKKFALLLVLLAAAAILWYASIRYLTGLYGTPKSLSEAGIMFGGINALFSGLALGGIIYAVWLQTIELHQTQRNIKESMKVTQASAELMAFAALLQEANNALERYERWEKGNNAGDYTQVKAKVRENINRYRASIEDKLRQINS